MLDFGAAGVVIPRVDGRRARPRDAADRTRYAAGRGLHGGVRAAGFGRDAGYRERADDERVVMVQIETRGALEEAAEIAALPGVDVLFLGPYDLGHALGLPPGPESPEMQSTAEAVAAAARAAGKAAAVFLGEPGLAARYRDARLHADRVRLRGRAAGRQLRRAPGGAAGMTRAGSVLVRIGLPAAIAAAGVVLIITATARTSRAPASR